MKIIIILMFISFEIALGQSNDKWNPIYSTEANISYIKDLAAYGDKLLAICGEDIYWHEGKCLFVSTDGGFTWNSKFYGSDEGLEKLYFLNDSILFVAGNAGLVIKYNLNQNQYYDYSTEPIYDITGIVPFSENELFINTSNLVLKTQNAGASWDTVFSSKIESKTEHVNSKIIQKSQTSENKSDTVLVMKIVGQHLESYLFAKNSNEIYFLTYVHYLNSDEIPYSLIYKSTDQGLTWNKLVYLKNDEIHYLSFSGSKIYCIGNFGLIASTEVDFKTMNFYKTDITKYLYRCTADNNSLIFSDLKKKLYRFDFESNIYTIDDDFPECMGYSAAIGQEYTYYGVNLVKNGNVFNLYRQKR